jgi:glucan phosphoethanolaminetransferase (alkaline phosphatase superfamily)
VYFTLLCNTQFWAALADERSAGWGTWSYLLAAGCALTGLHFLMLAPWLNRWTSRALLGLLGLLGLLVLLATGANFYAAKFNVYYEPSMLRNILQTDVKEATELLSLGMVLQILGLSLPALLLVFGVRLERRPPLRRMVGCGLALAVLVLGLGSIFKDFFSHMRNDCEVRYTDHVLAQTIDFLTEMQATHDTALIYVSDHGESLGENGIYLHGLPYSIAPKVQTHVPMVMWFSPGFAERRALDLACLQQVAQEKASHDHLFHTVLSLLDVRTQVHEASLDLTARCCPAG